MHAPAAVITVTDDGGACRRRALDSHGLQIMHERALLINADLTIPSAQSAAGGPSGHRATARSGTRPVVLPSRTPPKCKVDRMTDDPHHGSSSSTTTS